MKVGMYTEELKRPNVSSLFETIHTFGFQCVQWDFLSVCDDEMPEYVPEGKIEEICTVARKQHIEFAALTGTFNMAHPDCTVRENGLCRLQYMADLAPIFHCDLLTLCCGSRANDMWTIHPDNDTPDAWRDLLWTMERAVVIAEERNLKLGIEIEASNVVHTPAQARKLFDEIQSS